MNKAKVIETLEKLPNEFSTEELLEKLLFVDAVEQGLKDSEDGRTIPFDEVKAKMAAKWFNEFDSNRAYLEKELGRIKSGEGVSYTLDEVDAILESTIRKYEG